jgi:hypothetical protein
MAEHQILKVLNIAPGAQYPTYRFWVHLDTEKLAESGLPDPAFVHSYDFGTAPPAGGKASLSGEELKAALTEAVASTKAEMVKRGLLEGRAEVSMDELSKVESRPVPVSESPAVFTPETEP